MADVFVVPELEELQSLDNALQEAINYLDDKLIPVIDTVQQKYLTIVALVQGLDEPRNLSAITEQIPLSELQVVQTFSDEASKIVEAVDGLTTRIDETFEPVADLKETLEAHIGDAKAYVQEAQTFADKLDDAVDKILTAKTQDLDTNLQQLSNQRQQYLQEGSQALDQLIQEAINQLLDRLLQDITPTFEELTRDYVDTIGNAEQHVRQLNEAINEGIRKVYEPLEQTNKILSDVEPVLKQAEILL